ncbi:hypothetical protein CHS0354_015447 [Potamilus streckersoni]|uniref:G-protein coupled receptors family 1 profile domain-containing protein n=1 Tax=Potamilus streckersoni TaxID=2493646 RepID=A0AAE0VXQ0_9BIVA|nr:hypothetical protein CHS0354_015447 [Potamilus streckersoni]
MLERISPLGHDSHPKSTSSSNICALKFHFDCRGINKMELNFSILTNLTDTEVNCTQDLPLPMYTTIAYLLVITVVIGLLGNILVTMAILLNKRLHVQVYALLSQVAIVNALFSAFVVPTNIYTLLNPLWVPSLMFCSIIIYLTYILRCTSGLLVMIISIYRCALVCYSNVYKRIKSHKVVAGCCVFVWVETIVLVCGLGESVSFSLDSRTCALQGKYLETALTIFVYAPMLFVPIAMYLNIVFFVRKAKRRVQAHRSISSRNDKEPNQLNIMTALMSLNHLLTGVIPGIITAAIPPNHPLRGKIIVPSIFLFRITPVVDCVIYFFCNKSIRSSTVNIFTSFKPSSARHTSSDTQLQNISSIGNRNRNTISSDIRSRN